jgi:hypothetical protein
MILGGFLMLVSPFITITYNSPPCPTGPQCATFIPPVWLLPVTILMPVSGVGSILLAFVLRIGGAEHSVFVGRFSIILSSVYFTALTIVLAVDVSSSNTYGILDLGFLASIGPFLVMVAGLQLMKKRSADSKK